MTKTKPCIICDKPLECAFDDWATMQPHGGGEVRFVFSYGSKQFDLSMNRTEFIGVICDDCAKNYVDKMEGFLI